VPGGGGGGGGGIVGGRGREKITPLFHGGVNIRYRAGRLMGTAKGSNSRKKTCQGRTSNKRSKSYGKIKKIKKGQMIVDRKGQTKQGKKTPTGYDIPGSKFARANSFHSEKNKTELTRAREVKSTPQRSQIHTLLKRG